MVSKRLLYYLYALSLSCMTFTLEAQNKRRVDSLTKIISGKIHDTLLTQTLNMIAKEYWSVKPDTSLQLVLRSMKTAEKLQDKKYLCNCLTYLAYTYSALGNYDSSIIVYKQSIALGKSAGKKKSLGQALSGLGNVYNVIGDYDEAIKYYIEAVKIQEEAKDRIGLGKTYNSLGVLFEWQKEYKKSLDYHLKGLKIKEELHDSNAIAMSLNNIGIVYASMQDFDHSLSYHEKALKIREATGDAFGLLMSYNNLGNVYSKLGKNSEALNYYLKSYELAKEVNDKLNFARSSFSLGNEYFVQHKYAEGIKYVLDAKEIAEKLGVKELRRDIYATLVSYYSETKDYKTALDYAGMFRDVHDSIYNESKIQEIEELNTRYQTEKKEQENKALQLENDLSSKTIKQQRLITYFIIGGLLIVSVLAFFIFRGLKQQRRANAIISEQKTEVEHQKELVDEKNKEITDSINYAKRIQTALLPSTETFGEILPDSFVLFKPKDIVSGDFFWITQKDHYVFYVAADCTGHGVPGAFMSMLGTSFLNEIINEKNIHQPCDILDLLKIKIIRSLKQKGEVGGSKDGMDMVLCRLDKNRNELVFAAANNPLWLLREGKITEYKADKQPVGIGSEGFDHFNEQTITLRKGDTIYTFSDGFADQFGGPKGKKFKYKQLEEILVSFQNIPLSTQATILDEHFENWKSNLEQVDDVCVIGVRI